MTIFHINCRHKNLRQIQRRRRRDSTRRLSFFKKRNSGISINIRVIFFPTAPRWRNSWRERRQCWRGSCRRRSGAGLSTGKEFLQSLHLAIKSLPKMESYSSLSNSNSRCFRLFQLLPHRGRGGARRRQAPHPGAAAVLLLLRRSPPPRERPGLELLRFLPRAGGGLRAPGGGRAPRLVRPRDSALRLERSQEGL